MTLNLDERKEICRFFLEVVCLSRNVRITARALGMRSLLDSWFAYNAGGSFLTRNDNPRWLNVGDFKGKEAQKCIDMADFVSYDARRKIVDKDYSALMKDHVVPIRRLGKELRSATTTEDVERVLRNSYRIGIITAAEDLRLEEKLKEKMPDEWKVGDEVLARYRCVSITGEPGSRNAELERAWLFEPESR